MHALRNLHAALVPGGLLVDTQPLSPHPPVEADSGVLGALDMREWERTLATIDDRIVSTIRDGLYAVEHERCFVVTDSFDSGTEMLDVVGNWMGTLIPAEVADRAAAESGPVRVYQDVRLRLLRRSGSSPSGRSSMKITSRNP